MDQNCWRPHPTLRAETPIRVALPRLCSGQHMCLQSAWASWQAPCLLCPRISHGTLVGLFKSRPPRIDQPCVRREAYNWEAHGGTHSRRTEGLHLFPNQPWSFSAAETVPAFSCFSCLLGHPILGRLEGGERAHARKGEKRLPLPIGCSVHNGPAPAVNGDRGQRPH